MTDAPPSTPLPSRWRCLRARATTAAVLLIALLVWDGSRRVPAGPASGTRLAGTNDAPATPTLRIGTYNIHGGRGPDRRRDLARTAAVLRDLDVAGLNEVHGPGIAAVTGEDQATALGRMLGRGALFAPTERQWWRDHFGNGMLSRLPTDHWQRIPLPGSQQRGHRNVLLARLRHADRRISLLITHLDRRIDREEQLRAAVALFLALEPPAVLMGDLNTPSDDPQIRALLARADVRDPLTDHLGPLAPDRVDWILTRGLRTVSAGVVESDASDHPLYWAELE